MLIDVPVTIAFDCNSAYDAPKVKHTRVFTLRYDTEDSDVPAQYTASYPPRHDAYWSVDKEGMFFGLMPYGTESGIGAKVAKYPTDYCADEKEGEILQAEIDERETANSQFGVGA